MDERGTENEAAVAYVLGTEAGGGRGSFILQHIHQLHPTAAALRAGRFRAMGRRRRAVCCLTAPRDERDSRSLRNVSPLAGRSRGFVNYWRFASVIWWAPREEGSSNPSSRPSFSRFFAEE